MPGTILVSFAINLYSVGALVAHDKHLRVRLTLPAQAGVRAVEAKRNLAALFDCLQPGPSREWLKTKCTEVAEFVITGFRDSEPGILEAIRVAAPETLQPQGEVQFGVGRRLRELLQEIRLDEQRGRAVAVRPVLRARVKFFGRHRSGAIRDGVLQAVDFLSGGLKGTLVADMMTRWRA